MKSRKVARPFAPVPDTATPELQSIAKNGPPFSVISVAVCHYNGVRYVPGAAFVIHDEHSYRYLRDAGAITDAGAAPTPDPEQLDNESE